MSSSSELGRDLRRFCAKPLFSSEQQIVQLLKESESLGQEGLQKAVNAGNRNGKTPLMFAAQFRRDSVASELIKYGADVNAHTRRGHTALIFAAGRGNDSVVHDLLQCKARIRICTVTGDSALTIGAHKLHESTLELMKDHEAKEKGQWDDFRHKDDANLAQEEHAKVCRFCQERIREAALAVGQVPVDPMDLRIEEAVQKVLRYLNSSNDAHELSDALIISAMMCNELFIQYKPSRRQRKRLIVFEPPAEVALSRAMVCFLAGQFQEDQDMAYTNMFDVDCAHNPGKHAVLLMSCRAESLLAALRRQGLRDQRSVYLVLASLLRAVREQVAFDPSIISDCDPDLAIELYLARPWSGEPYACHPIPAAEICKVWFATLGALVEQPAFGELMFRARPQYGVKHGVRVSSLLKVATFIESVPWPDICPKQEVTASFLEYLMSQQNQDFLRSWKFAVQTAPVEDSWAPYLAPPVRQALPKKPLAPLVPAIHPRWVEDDAGLQDLLEELRGDVDVGVDCEWGDDPDAPPSLIQLALSPDERTYLIDVLACRHLAALAEVVAILMSPTQDMFSQSAQHNPILIETPKGQNAQGRSFDSVSTDVSDHDEPRNKVQVIGFAFTHDRIRLSRLFSEVPPGFGDDVIDIQNVVIAQLQLERPPSLQRTVASLLGQSLDKSLQCSDWDQRPLTMPQIAYAALDAAVLLRLHSVLQSPDGCEHYSDN